MSHLAAGHSLEALFLSMPLVEFVGRKRAVIFFPPFFSLFNARLVICLSILAAPSMGMMGKFELRQRRGADVAPSVRS